MPTCSVRESVVMSCDTEIGLMRPSGRALGLMQRTISAYAAGSGDICNRLTASRRRHADDGTGGAGAGSRADGARIMGSA